MAIWPPLSFRFVPTDQELIGTYLSKRVQGVALPYPYDRVLHDENLFGTKEPMHIWEEYYGGDLNYDSLYFFCQQTRTESQMGNSRINRKVGGEGIWIQLSSSQPIRDQDYINIIGQKREFRYEKPNSKLATGWYLDEYSIYPEDGQNHDLVICRLRRKTMKSLHP